MNFWFYELLALATTTRTSAIRSELAAFLHFLHLSLFLRGHAAGIGITGSGAFFALIRVGFWVSSRLATAAHEGHRGNGHGCGS